MSLFESIVNHFNANIDVTSRNIESLTPHIAEAIHLFIEALSENRKILVCASGDSEASGRHFCQRLFYNSQLPRPSLPALFLEAGHSNSFFEQELQNETYSRQLQSFSTNGDILLIFSTSGVETSLLKAIEYANDNNVHLVVIAGGDNNDIANAVPSSEVVIPCLGLTTIETIGLQFQLGLLLSTLIEQELFGNHQQ